MFFTVVIDVRRMIVGWQFASNLRTDLVLDALQIALTTRAPVLTSRSFNIRMPDVLRLHQELDDRHDLESTGSVGDALDNAMGRELRRQLRDRS